MNTNKLIAPIAISLCRYYNGGQLPNPNYNPDELALWNAEKNICNICELDPIPIENGSAEETFLSFVAANIATWIPYGCVKIIKSYLRGRSENIVRNISKTYL